MRPFNLAYMGLVPYAVSGGGPGRLHSSHVTHGSFGPHHPFLEKSGTVREARGYAETAKERSAQVKESLVPCRSLFLGCTWIAEIAARCPDLASPVRPNPAEHL